MSNVFLNSRNRFILIVLSLLLVFICLRFKLTCNTREENKVTIVKAYHDLTVASKLHIGSTYRPIILNSSVSATGEVYPLPSRLPKSDVAPATVHYLWCSGGYFEYRHYLSFMSFYNAIQPAKIVFHYTSLPGIDSRRYYLWFKELKESVSSLVLRELSPSACGKDTASQIGTGLSILRDGGGIFVSAQTVLASFPPGLFDQTLGYSVGPPTGSPEGVVIVAKKGLKYEKGQDGLRFLREKGKALTPCVSHEKFGEEDGGSKPYCIVINKQIYPRDVWEAKTAFAGAARMINYRTPKPMTPVPSRESLVPLLVHYVWFGGNQLNFLAYLSILSSMYVLRADHVFIHADREPKGSYWQKVKAHSKVKLIWRDQPEKVFQNDVKVMAHSSDITRVQILLQYGGVYNDMDVIWVKELSEDLRAHEFVMAYDWRTDGYYPEVFNNGVMLAKPGARYLRQYHETFRWYEDKDWSFNSLRMTYKTYEKHPDCLFMERHLQVVCYYLKCHPIWVPGYHDEGRNHLNSAKFDWRNDTFALHWTHPDPPEFGSQEKLLQSTSMFAEIGKFVLKKSKII